MRSGQCAIAMRDDSTARQSRREALTGTIDALRDDLAVVDVLEVDRGDAEVGVAEVALDEYARHALVGHLDGAGRAGAMHRRRAPARVAASWSFSSAARAPADDGERSLSGDERGPLGPFSQRMVCV